MASRNAGRNRRTAQRREQERMLRVALVGDIAPRLGELGRRLCPDIPQVVELPDTSTAEEQYVAGMELLRAVIEGSLATLDRLDVDLDRDRRVEAA